MQASTNDVDQHPLISIVTPSYNAMPYIIENIESVLAQDYPNFEHIIYDGGSTDGTVDVFENYDHLTWVSEADRGQSHALNKGFQRAKGEFIGWLNADDTYQAGAIPFAVQYLQTHPTVDVIHSDVQLIGEDSNSIKVVKAQEVDTTTLLTVNHIKQPTIFMRRQVIDQLVGLDENLHYVMDWEFWLRVSVTFKIQYIPDCILANFRLAPGTKSFEATPEFSHEWITVLEKTLHTSKFGNLMVGVKHSAIRRMLSQNHIAHTVKAIENRERKAAFRHLAQAIRFNWGLILNRGTYLFALKSMQRKHIDRMRKYKKR